MDKAEAKALYERASGLFATGNYAQATGILRTLDEEFPGERHIMLARARCLGKLGHVEEAVALCNELIGRYDYQKALALKAELEADTVPIERPTTFSLAAVETEWTAPRPERTNTAGWQFEWIASINLILALGALGLGGTGVFLGLQEYPGAAQRGAAFLVSAFFVLLAGIPALYSVSFFREGVAYILWAALPMLFLSVFTVGMEGEFDTGFLACCTSAFIFAGAILVNTAIALAGIWLVLWLWDDMGVFFWLALVFTMGSFFMGLLAAKINTYVAYHLGRFVTGEE